MLGTAVVVWPGFRVQNSVRLLETKSSGLTHREDGQAHCYYGYLTPLRCDVAVDRC